MRWEKLNNKINLRLLAIFVFIIFYFITRVPRLDSDIINPDGVNWHFRSQQFINGLKEHNWEKTYQHYHPGVSLMLITGSSIEVFKRLNNITNYDIYNFQSFDLIAKYSLIIVQLILTLISLYLLSSIMESTKKALIFTILLSFEPFILGNSRLYHLDVLFMLFSLNSLLFFYSYLEKKTIWFALLAGIFAGLSFLTKSVSVGIPLFFIGVASLLILKRKSKLFVIKGIAVFLTSMFVTVFLLFPALWVAPISTLTSIFHESVRIGVRNGHEQVVLGETTMNAGPSFYPLTLLVKMSPFLLVLALIGIYISFFAKNKSLPNKWFLLYMSAFYIGYLLAMSLPAKKIDRYMVEIFPLFVLFAVESISLIKTKTQCATFGFAYLLFVLWPIYNLFPYYFTYTSPLVGNSTDANRIIAQKPFGVGIHDLKSYIVSIYGNGKRLGFIDTKPMRAIYANSRVFDIRVNGTNDYDLLVLGVNEELPEKVINSKTKFEKAHSLYINGLEYWRIYEKSR